MTSRWRRIPAGVSDVAVAAGVAATVLIAGRSGSQPKAELAGYVLLAMSGLALAGRRRAPLVVLVVTGLCALGYQGAGFDVPAVAFLFAVYGAVRAGYRLVTALAAVGMLVALPVVGLVSTPELSVGEALVRSRGALEIAWLVAAGAAGEALRQAERRAEEAERTREETALRRAGEERLHLARELHDSLTHQISVIKVQATVAVHLARKRGEQVPEPLLVIEQAGRDAARELRATLDALRNDHAAPAYGIDHIPDLVQRARTGGLETTLAIEGEPGGMPHTVDRTAYRIVQESLTNVTRHAGAATATVSLMYRPDALVIRVDDDGAAKSQVTSTFGVGLRGMRERVTALGGLLQAGPREGGGYRVHAELPLDQSA